MCCKWSRICLILKGYEASPLEGPGPGRWRWFPLLLALVLGMLALAKLSYKWGAASRPPTPQSFLRHPLICADDAAVLRRPGADQRDLRSGVNEAYNNYLLESNPNQEGSPLPDYIDISPFAAGVATIGFPSSAPTTETFRRYPGGGQGRAGSRSRLGMRANPGVCTDPSLR